jgi:hypothetical protein
LARQDKRGSERRAGLQDPYEVLGVAPDATPEEIKGTYLALVQIYHPDRLAESSDMVLAQANRRLQVVTEAYNAVRGGWLVYWETPGWTNSERASVTVKLLQARVPHRWDEDGVLSVNRLYEAAVDGVVASRT